MAKPSWRPGFQFGPSGRSCRCSYSILWSPFLLVAHCGVLLARALGSPVLANGFSAPYRYAMAFGTGVYGFLALLISFRLACKCIVLVCFFIATIAIWWASSLPVYMYFNPSWSHTHSAFMVALFLWYWDATRKGRSLAQWFALVRCRGTDAGRLLCKSDGRRCSGR
jgi:hypothetical protein